MKALSDYVKLAVGDAVPLIAFKASADVVSKAVTLVVTVAAARELSPHSFGVLALAMTTGWLIGIATDAGLPLYLARESARHAADPAAMSATFRRVWRLRSTLAVVAFGAATIGVTLWTPADVRLAFLIIVFSQLAGAALETVAHLFRGMGRSEIESRIVIAQRLATAALVLLAIVTRPSLTTVAFALAIPPSVGLLVSWVVATRLLVRSGGAFLSAVASAKAEAPPTLGGPEGPPLRTLAREALPIGAGIFLSALYFRCDVYFVEYWHGLADVGRYNAVFRLIEALRLFPAAVLAVMFPVLCRATTAAAVGRLSIALGGFGVLALAAVFFSAHWIVGLVYGSEYLSAVPALQILAFALPLFFINYALTHQVIAWNGQRAYLVVTFLALVTNVMANVLLIPAQGIAGAAAATVVTEVTVLAGCVLVLRAHLHRREEGAVIAVPNPVS